MAEIQPGNCSSNENLNCSIHLQRDDQAIPLVFIPIMIVGVLILVVNGGVLGILAKDKNIRQNPYLFLVLMLCLSDFTVGVGIMFIGPIFVNPSVKGNKILTVLQIVFMTNGMCLSILQTFLISLQRYVVLCKENWNLYIFQHNRKYFVCFGSLSIVTIINFVLISPPHRNFDVFKDRAHWYVYHGHYLGYSIYIRILLLSLLTLTLIFYFMSVSHVLKAYKKINPKVNSNSTHLKTNRVQMIQLSATIGDLKGNNAINGNHQEKSQSKSERQLISLRQKKVVSTLKLVGLLIILLVILTGPSVFSLWNDKMSSYYNGVASCLLVLNSLTNPFIYLWRLYDIRGIVKSKLCCVGH